MPYIAWYMLSSIIELDSDCGLCVLVQFVLDRFKNIFTVKCDRVSWTPQLFKARRTLNWHATLSRWLIAHRTVSSHRGWTITSRHVWSATNLNKLQVSQNTLARAMCQTLQSVSATEENYAIAINPPTKNAK